MSACDADAAEREPAIEVPSCAAGERCVLVTDSSGCECTVTWSCAAGWEGHAIVGGGGAGSDGGGGSPTCRQACEGDADCVDGYREDASLVTDVAETGSNCAPLRAIGWCTGTGSDGAGEMTCARACDHLPTPVCVEDDAA